MRSPAVLLLLAGLASAPAAALAPDDREALGAALRSLGSGDDPVAAARAGEILEDPGRLGGDSAEFFVELFATDPLTTGLARFLGDRALRA